MWLSCGRTIPKPGRPPTTACILKRGHTESGQNNPYPLKLHQARIERSSSVDDDLCELRWHSYWAAPNWTAAIEIVGKNNDTKTTTDPQTTSTLNCANAHHKSNYWKSLIISDYVGLRYSQSHSNKCFNECFWPSIHMNNSSVNPERQSPSRPRLS